MEQPPRPVLILTRPADASLRTLQALGDQPAEIVVSPLIRITHLSVGEVPGEVAGLILTSANGAVAAMGLGFPSGLRTWCVGANTAAIAEEFGFVPVAVADTAEDLLKVLQANRPSGPLLHVRGEHSRGRLASRLSASGLACNEVISYRQEPLPLTMPAKDALVGAAPVILPVYSPRTAAILIESGEFSAPIHIVALSSAVAEVLGNLRSESVAVARAPNGAAMIEAILRKIAALSPVQLESHGRTD